MTERLTDEALLPCPFCGGKPTVRLDDLINGRIVADPLYYVECENPECGVWPEASGFDREYQTVIAAWNRRATPADDLREALGTLLVQANGVEPQDAKLRQNVIRIANAALSQNGGAA